MPEYFTELDKLKINPIIEIINSESFKQNYQGESKILEQYTSIPNKPDEYMQIETICDNTIVFDNGSVLYFHISSDIAPICHTFYKGAMLLSQNDLIGTFKFDLNLPHILFRKPPFSEACLSFGL